MQWVRRLRFFALFTAIGLLLFGHFYLDDLAHNTQGTALPRFIEEMTGAYAALALLPLVVGLVRRFPFTARGWPAALGANLIGVAVYTIGHTTLMLLSRMLLFPLAGLGSYDYGNMFYRYPMEASMDIISYAAFFGFTYFFDRVRQARTAEIATATLKTELAEAKLENLRLQLHPHFLFNTLNAISSVMYEDVRKADTMIARLSEFLRFVLASADVPEISLDEELEVERMYVDIMKARLESKLRLTLEVESGVRAARVPTMLLQPLIENSIRHGMTPECDELDIIISARRDNGTTVIHVRDNGVGFADEGLRRGGLGLANVRSRLEHLYGDACEFNIGAANGGGTDVRLAFPHAEPCAS